MPHASTVLEKWKAERHYLLCPIASVEAFILPRQVGAVMLVHRRGDVIEPLVIHPFPAVADMLTQIRELKERAKASSATHVAFRFLGIIDDSIDSNLEHMKTLRMVRKYSLADHFQSSPGPQRGFKIRDKKRTPAAA